MNQVDKIVATFIYLRPNCQFVCTQIVGLVGFTSNSMQFIEWCYGI